MKCGDYLSVVFLKVDDAQEMMNSAPKEVIYCVMLWPCKKAVIFNSLNFVPKLINAFMYCFVLLRAHN